MRLLWAGIDCIFTNIIIDTKIFGLEVEIDH